MSESEVLGTEGLIRALHDKLFDDDDDLSLVKDGRFDSTELTKTEGLVTLFKKIDDFLSSKEKNWYIKTDKDLEQLNKADLFAEFAVCFFKTADKNKFTSSPLNFYNKSAKVPMNDFWVCLCRSVGIGVFQVEAWEQLTYELVQVDWKDLVEEHKNDDGGIDHYLNLGIEYPKWKTKLSRYQRPRRWDGKKSLGLAKSLKDGFPIPALIVFKDDDYEQYDVLDGQQRIHAIITTREEWVDQIPEHSKACVYVISAKDGANRIDTRKAVIRLYQRLNQGGVNLKKLEIFIGVFENKPIIDSLIKMVRDILSSDENKEDWKGYLAKIYKPKKGKKNLLSAERQYMEANELDLFDLLLRPLVYGMYLDEKLQFHGTTSNDGIEKLLEKNFSEEELENIVQRLTNSFESAYRVFPDCYLRMVKSKDGVSEEIQWQSSRTANKTATALQVGGFFATKKLTTVLTEHEIDIIHQLWIDFMNGVNKFEKNGYLDSNGIPSRQNTESLWRWQRNWVEELNPISKSLKEDTPESILEIERLIRNEGNEDLRKRLREMLDNMED